MASHFARGVINPRHLTSSRIPPSCHDIARRLPEHRSARFIAARALLAELIFMLYGSQSLPEMTTSRMGKPIFCDRHLPNFSFAYAGNMVGVAIATEGYIGLDMEIQRPAVTFPPHTETEPQAFTRSETTWINNQTDRLEATQQLATLRSSIQKMLGVTSHSPLDLQLQPGAGRLRVTEAPKAEALSDAEQVLIWSLCSSISLAPLKLWEFNNRDGWRNLPDVSSRCGDPDNRFMRFTSMPSDNPVIIN